MSRNKKYMAAIAILSVSAIGLWAATRKPAVGHLSKSTVQVRKYTERELLDRLAKVAGHLGPNSKELRIVGTFGYKEIGTGTSVLQEPVPYVFARKDHDFYYRMGNLEYYNSEKLGVTVDKDGKKIMVAKSVPPTMAYAMSDQLRKMSELTASEGYQLSVSSEGDKQTVSLRNEMHISCREYQVTYDTVAFLPTRLFARLTGTANVKQTAGERHLTIDMKACGHDSMIESYMSGIPVKKEKRKIVLKEDYKGYQIIGTKLD